MEQIREQANKWIVGKYSIPDALPKADKIIQGLLQAWDDEKNLSNRLFDRAQRAEGELSAFKEENAYLLDKLSPIGRGFDPVKERDAAYDLGFREGTEGAQTEIETLQSLVPHNGDGSCDICGAAPTTEMMLCSGCREKVAE